MAALSEAPSAVQAVIELVLPDLQVPTPVDLVVRWEPDGETVWISDPGDTGWAGFYAGDTCGTDLVVGFADWLQEQVFAEAGGAWGEARPGCPGHPHPTAARELQGAGWWVCPRDMKRIAKIGDFAALLRPAQA